MTTNKYSSSSSQNNARGAHSDNKTNGFGMDPSQFIQALSGLNSSFAQNAFNNPFGQNYQQNLAALNEAGKMAVQIFESISQMQTHYLQQAFQDLSSFSKRFSQTGVPGQQSGYQGQSSKNYQQYAQGSHSSQGSQYSNDIATSWTKSNQEIIKLLQNQAQQSAQDLEHLQRQVSNFAKTATNGGSSSKAKSVTSSSGRKASASKKSPAKKATSSSAKTSENPTGGFKKSGGITGGQVKSISQNKDIGQYKNASQGKISVSSRAGINQSKSSRAGIAQNKSSNQSTGIVQGKAPTKSRGIAQAAAKISGTKKSPTRKTGTGQGKKYMAGHKKPTSSSSVKKTASNPQNVGVQNSFNPTGYNNN